MSKRIILLGGLGNIGTHILSNLVNLDFFCLVIDQVKLPLEFTTMKNLTFHKVDNFHNFNMEKIFFSFKPDIILSLIDFGLNGEDMLNKEKCFQVNFEGIKNIIETCKACNISKLIFSSSENVVFENKPIYDGDESLVYPDSENYLDYYSSSKAAAEKLLLESNGILINGGNRLITSAIRQSQIYGVKNSPLFNQIVSLMDAGLIWFKFGHTTCNWVHIDNLVILYSFLNK